MQAAMNIIVTVRGAKMAQAEMTRVATATRAVQAATVAGNAAAMGMGGGLRNLTRGMERYGKNMQWVGRQIEYNFTLPIALAVGMTSKWALENEAAMVRMRKVYGDTSMPTQQLTAETEALGRAFRFLSDNFGVTLSEVIEVGATWAQAGAENIAVANGVRASLEMQLLGQMDLADSTEALIAIQAQYGASSTELSQIIADLNAVENETSVRMRDLIDGMQRAGGVAREAGVDHRELAGFIAAMVPAAGNASEAGNSLKTTITRIMAPTRQAEDAMKSLGIETDSLAWRNATATERFLELGQALDQVSAEQRTVALTHIAGRRQVSRLAIMLRDMTNEVGRYNTAMQSNADPADAMLRKQRELEMVLRSTPQGLKILTTQLRNYGTDIAQEILPALIATVAQIRDWVRAFAELDPQLRNTIVAFVLLIAVVGPLVRILGSTVLLVTQFIKFFGSFVKVALGGAIAIFKVGTAFKFIAGKLWIVGEAFSMLGSVLRGFFALWSKVILGAAAMFGAFAKTVAFALANIAQAFVTFIAGQVIPYIIRWVALTSTAAFIMGTSLLSTLLPALATTARGFLAWAGQAILASTLAMRQFVANILVGATMLLSTMGGALAVSGRQVLLWAGRFVTGAAIMSASFLVGLIPKMLTWLSVNRAVIALTLKAWFIYFASIAKAIVAFIAGPWGLLIAGVAAAVYAFRDQISQGIDWVIQRWNQMPGAIANALRAVVQVIRDAAVAAYEWLSYLNPFVRHSPSLVESVRMGVRIIAREYASLANIGSVFNASLAVLDRFKAATAKARREMRATEVSQMRSDVVGVSPGAGGAFDAMIAGIRSLEGALVRVERQYQAQDRVVTVWQQRLDSANRTVEQAERRLDALSRRAADLGDALWAAQDGLHALANMPIVGMREMEDAIWANEMAQKKLRLRMLEIEDVHGPVDDLRRKMAALQGDIEMLSGQREDLRLAGAGSDVLGAYDAQIDAMRAAQRALMDSDGGESPVSEYDELQSEMEKLRREAERLRLEMDIKYDPMTRQIERMVDGYKELPFNQIVSGIKAQQAEVARLTAAYDQANAAVAEQQRVVEEATRARDAIEARYDAEYEALQRLGAAYNAIQDQIRDMNSELEGFARDAASRLAAEEAARKAAEAAAKAAKKGGAGGGAGIDGIDDWGDFDIPGGAAGLSREEGDIDDLIAQWEMEDLFQDVFGNFDMFAPIKDMWNNLTDWLSDRWQSFSGWLSSIGIGGEGGIFDGIRNAWESVKNQFTSDEGLFTGLWNGVIGAVDAWRDALERVWSWLSGPLHDTWQVLRDAVVSVVEVIKGHWDAFWDSMGGDGGTFQKAMTNIGKAVQAIATVVAAAFQVVMAIVISAWEGILKVIEPLWNAVVNIIDAALTVIRGIIQTVMSLIAGDWAGVWEGIKMIFSGIWDAILAILEGAWNIFKGIFEGIWTFLKGLWEKIYNWLVGNSIIPDLVNAITGWFQKLWDWAVDIWNGIKDAIVGAVEWVRDRLTAIWEGLTGWLSGIWNGIGDTAKNAWNKTRDFITGAISKARDTVKERISDLRTWVSDRWNNMRDNARDRWNDIRDRIGNALTQTRARVETAVNGIKNWTKARWDEMTKDGGLSWGNTRDMIMGQVNSLRSRMTPVVDFIDRHFGDTWRKMRDTAMSVWNNIRDRLRTITDSIRNTFSNAVNAITNIWDRIRNAIRKPIAAAVNVAVNPIIRGINSVATRVGLKGFPLVSIPSFHRGGHVEPGGGQRRNLASNPLKNNEVLAVLLKGERVLTEEEQRVLQFHDGGQVGSGGFWSSVGDVVSGVTSKVADMGKAALQGLRNLIANTVKPLIDAAVKGLSSIAGSDTLFGQIVGGAGRRLGDAALNFIRGVEDGANKGEIDAARKAAPAMGSATRPPTGGGASVVMDSGGLLRQGWNAPIYNGTGRPELVSPERLMRRIVREEVRAHGGDGDRTININGDLVLPNIKSGDDAEDFIRNIETLAGR